MSSLKELAAKFQVEQLPTGADMYARAEFLQYWAKSAEAVIAALPSPSIVEESAFSDLKAVEGSLRSLVDKATDLVTNPSTELAASTVRNVLILAFVTATWGMPAHTPNVSMMLVGEDIMSPEDLAADYKRRIGVFQAIAKLGKSGALDPLFAQKKSLGLAPVVIGGVAVSGWLIIALVSIAAITLAFIVISLYALFQTTRLIDKYAEKFCLDQQGNPIPATAGPCMEWLSDLNQANTDLAKGPQKLLNTVLTYGAIGLGVYAAIVFMPDVIRSLRESRRAAAG